MANDSVPTVLDRLRRLFTARQTSRLADRHLLQRFLADRDEAAFAALVQRHGPMVFGVCRSVLRQQQDAEDAYQATFLVLARRAAAVRRQDSLASWLHGVAYRLSLKARTLDARRRARERAALPQPVPESMDDLTWRELRAVLHEELDRLREQLRAPLVLCCLEGKTLDEAAQQLGWKATTLKGRLDRGRKLLRARLLRRGLALSVPLFATLLSQNESSAVPAALAEATVQGARAFATGSAAGAVSASALALAEGGLKAMFLSKLKTAIAVGLTATVLMVTVGLALGSRRDEPRPAPPVPPGGDLVARGDDAPKKEDPVKPAPIEVKGRVVDDETGKPVTRFVEQGGRVDPKDPKKVTWGYHETRRESPNAEGTLRATVDWEGGWRLRILAPGYLPQPVFESDPPKGTRSAEVVVRMKRGLEILGRVTDHTGKPVADAAVFLAGSRPVSVTGGKAVRNADQTEDKDVTRTTTDKDGRFTLHGSGGDDNRVAVSAPGLDLWVVPAPEPGLDLAIKLPEPGKLTIHYDIDGGPVTGTFLLQLKSYEMPGWEGVQNLRELTADNHGKLVLENVTPGQYELTRTKTLRVGGMGRTVMCDRRTVTVAAGKSVDSDFVRDKGVTVTGQIPGMEGLGVPGAYLFVRPPEATGDPRNINEAFGPLSEALPVAPDGKFTTERLLPGEYRLIAEAYLPETPQERVRLGMRLPSFVGNVKVTVPKEGKVEPVVIKLEKSKR
jgi:RNA polymerase sigma factor (sigma-70 family)